MGKRGERSSPSRRWRRWGVALGGVFLVVAGVGAFWWSSEPQVTSGGTPHLVVDRTEVDLGYRRFDTPARTVFTLSNTGSGELRLREVPPVILKAGC